MIEIIKNAAKPIAPEPRGRPSVYPFDSLAVGDAFDIPLNGEEKAVMHKRIYSAAHSHKRKNQIEYGFIIGTSPDDLDSLRFIRTK